jgi:hypothetical protein
VKSLIITAISFFTFTVALAWTPLSLPRIETKQVKVYSDTGNVYPKTVEVINQVALQRALTQIENAIKDDRAVIDSVFPQYGVATANSAGTDTITLAWPYKDSLYAVFPCAREWYGGSSPSVAAWPLTDSTFAVRFFSAYEFTFQWHTIGRK